MTLRGAGRGLGEEGRRGGGKGGIRKSWWGVKNMSREGLRNPIGLPGPYHFLTRCAESEACFLSLGCESWAVGRLV